MSSLVIVESPAKAKTISKFLGNKYLVLSSLGHVRDLPTSKMGVDVEKDFTPHYVISPAKAKVVKELKARAAKADGILFATDEDREGEAISWHLAHILGIEPAEAQRITFHEITKQAIEQALASPRPIDLRLVDAQQARRVLDRLVGYELSPFLWRKVAKGLSAGRVQSVAVRLVVEREREIKNFKAEEYWTIEGDFTAGETSSFSACLQSVAGAKLGKMGIKNKEQADKILTALDKASYQVAAVEEKKMKRLPSPAFTTSTLQQEANSRLGFSAKQTMRLAQQLYEGVNLGADGSVGLITYMRTDSVNLSEKFLGEAKETIGKKFGARYQLNAPRFFKSKSKNAQEAHEAIRPTEVWRAPEEVAPHLDKNQLKLYDLIWRRALASQMAAAELNATAIDIASHNQYIFRASGQTIIFDGFLKLYPDRAKENILPIVKAGEPAACLGLKPEQHFTEPPARYSDAALVKALEQYGIGRPSTYAPTIATIEERGYVERDDHKRLAPRDIALVVNDLLVEHFPHVVDYQFTAQMEEGFDEIARGEKRWQPFIGEFYWPFKANLEKKYTEISKKEITEEKSDEVCEKCGQPMIIKMGRYGKFLACSGFPACRNIKSLDNGKPGAAAEPTNEVCDKCGQPMVKKIGRYGPFLSCSAYPQCKNIKNIANKTGVPCPQCGQGEIVQRRSKRGRTFYSCDRYPACEFALWNKPTGAKCPHCGSLLVFGAKEQINCSNKTCARK